MSKPRPQPPRSGTWNARLFPRSSDAPGDASRKKPDTYLPVGRNSSARQDLTRNSFTRSVAVKATLLAFPARGEHDTTRVYGSERRYCRINVYNQFSRDSIVYDLLKKSLTILYLIIQIDPYRITFYTNNYYAMVVDRSFVGCGGGIISIIIA